MIHILLAGDDVGARFQTLDSIQNTVRSMGIEGIWHWAGHPTSSPATRIIRDSNTWHDIDLLRKIGIPDIRSKLMKPGWYMLVVTDDLNHT